MKENGQTDEMKRSLKKYNDDDKLYECSSK